MLISILTVLSILTAVSSLTVVFIPTVVYILTVVSSLSVHTHTHSKSYFHVILISAYPAVRVKFYAYAGRNDLQKTNLLSSLQACNYAKGRNQRRNNANDSFGKGFHVLKDHVLNRLMTGVHHYCYGRSSTRFFSKIASIFKKVLHLKDLNEKVGFKRPTTRYRNNSISCGALLSGTVVPHSGLPV